ncbi:MAG: ABC transporter permease subunit [Burkholderiaceae bacterium]
MSGFGAILRKELREYFAAPIAPVLLATFWALTGYFFSFNLFIVNAVHMVTSFHNMSLLLLLLMPLMTMRIFAEENKSGTLELLMTLPLTEVQIVLGKYAAAAIVLLLMLAGTSTAVVPLILFGKPDLGPVLGGYLGIALLGSAFAAIGLFVSSMCTNQIVAAAITWAVLLGLWFADYAAGIGWAPALAPVFSHLSFSVHYIDLIRGVFSSASLAYFGSIVVVSLVASIVVLRERRL